MPLHLHAMCLCDVFCAPEHLIKEVSASYLADTILYAPLLFGSLDILGNPTFFIGRLLLLLLCLS